MNSDNDLDQFRLPTQAIAIPSMAPRIVSAKLADEWFIKGPIPGTWLLKADELPGKYTHRVAWVILYVRGLQGRDSVALERFHFSRFGVKKDSARRALERLQKAGLIQYVRLGQKFKVSILSVSSYTDQSTPSVDFQSSEGSD